MEEEGRMAEEATPAGWPLSGLLRSSLCFHLGRWEKGSSLGGPVVLASQLWFQFRFGRQFVSSWSESRGHSRLLGADCVTCRLLVLSPNLVVSLMLRPAWDFCGTARVPAGEQGGRDSERLSVSPEVASAGQWQSQNFRRACVSAPPFGLFASLTCGVLLVF